MLRTLIRVSKLLAIFLTVLLGAPQAWAQSAPVPPSSPANLVIRVVEGDGMVYPLGSRATRGVTVLVADETGRPVPGVTVSFTLPSGGPGGTFASGVRNELATTQNDGRASVWGMQWNRMPGPFDIRITAAKGQARAGIITTAYLGESGQKGANRSNVAGKSGPDAAEPDTAEQRPAPRIAASRIGAKPPSSGSHKWLWIGLAVGGAAAAGAVGLSSKSATTASTSAAVSIGAPTITLGRQ